jgi:hypothetical protein
MQKDRRQRGEIMEKNKSKDGELEHRNFSLIPKGLSFVAMDFSPWRRYKRETREIKKER